MRFPKPRRHQTRTKNVIMTGGLNNIVTNLELKEGELYKVQNYMEIDSPYHGYASVDGYEVYDGKTAPSDVNAPTLIDEGDDSDTTFLVEAPTGVLDISSVDNPIVNNGVIVNTIVEKFLGGSFDFAGTNFNLSAVVGYPFTSAFSTAFDAATSAGGAFSFQGNWTMDFQIRPKIRAEECVVMEKAGVARLRLSVEGLLTFELSSTSAYVYDYAIAMQGNNLGVSLFAHVSIQMRNGVLMMAVDGIPIKDLNGDQITTVVPNVYNSQAKVYFGSSYIGTDYYLGYLDEIRYSRGARWYHPFTPPTKRYTNPTYQTINWDDEDREIQRASITEVPGSGPVLGVHIYKGEVYALRNAENGISAALWKAYSEYTPFGIDDSLSGWELIDDTFLPDGRMDAINWRFSGSFSDQQVMCIVDGASVPRIYDYATDTMYVFDNVESAGIPDRQVPARYATHVSIFDNRLVLGYKEDDIVLSSKTDPRDYTGGYGDQLLIGDEITNLKELPGEALGIFCRNSLKVLTKLEVPSSTAATPDYTFRVENFSRKAGGFARTAERVLDKIVYADDRGVIDFDTTDKFGDFSAAAISKKLNRIFLQQKQFVSCALVERQINQYRLFFSTGASLWFTFEDGQLKGGTLIVYPDPCLICTEGEDSNGDIMKFFTSDDGYVYKMDSGTSFNGAEITTQLNTSFYHYGSPRYWKQFHRVIFEMDASKGTVFAVRPVFDYDSHKLPDTEWWIPLLVGVSGTWDVDSWGEFIWGGSVTQELIHYIRGHGRNMSLEMMTSSKYNQRHIVHNAIVDFQLENKQE